MVLGPQFLEGGDTPYFGNALSTHSHFRSSCGPFCLSCVQRARRVADEKKKKIEDRIAAKLKSADDYIGRPKKKESMHGRKIEAFRLRRAASSYDLSSYRWCSTDHYCDSELK